jgi:hypothetical protein
MGYDENVMDGKGREGFGGGNASEEKRKGSETDGGRSEMKRYLLLPQMYTNLINKRVFGIGW